MQMHSRRRLSQRRRGLSSPPCSGANSEILASIHSFKHSICIVCHGRPATKTLLIECFALQIRVANVLAAQHGADQRGGLQAV